MTLVNKYEVIYIVINHKEYKHDNKGCKYLNIPVAFNI